MSSPLPPCPNTQYTDEAVPGTSTTPEVINTETYTAESPEPVLVAIASNCVNEELLAPYIIYNGAYLYNDAILYDATTIL